MMPDISFKPSYKPVIILGAAAILGVGGLQGYQIVQSQRETSKKPQVSQITTPQINTITALGRLEPQGEVIKLSAPTSSQGYRVEKILVKEGDQVKTGQVIAILDSISPLEAAYQEAKAAVKIAQVNLEKVKQGAKTGEIQAQTAEIARIEAQKQGDENGQKETIARLEAQWQGETTAQRATINRLQAELKNAQVELQRYQQLYRDGAISQSLFDSKNLSVDTITQQLREAKANLQRIDSTGRKQINEAKNALTRIQNTGSKQVTSAKATLDKIAEVRPVDIAAAQAELSRAMAAAKQAKANLDQAYVKSPQDGVIFDIYTHAGEVVSNEGIVEIGQTNQMFAVAEVYQSDISKIRNQQQVKISSVSLPQELQGTVESVGWKVQRQNVINADPSENIDSRVVEVHVKLDQESSNKAAKFTNLQVKAVFLLDK
ncbi:MAG: biotin/lipoyl-binding protein [Nostocales cyanobacterium]|nr:MAG: biotin/lipoyl-binding protein [Nostocales cyanobacterium]TAF20457.1 MAG: biotin/lipoyl-binding protein [Nostocales cyanobacterium]